MLLTLSTTTNSFCPSFIYTYTTFGLITNIASNRRIGTYLQISPCFRFFIVFGRMCSGFVRSDFLLSVCRFPSGGTDFPTSSPFTPAWADLPFWSVFGTHRASQLRAPWLACPTRSPPCGSLLEQSLYLLPSPGASDISFGCAWSWSGRLRSLQGGWRFDCRSEAGIPPIGFLALRWSPSRLSPCQLLQLSCTPLLWLIVPRTSAAWTTTILLPPHRSSRIRMWTGWYLHQPTYPNQ